MLRTLNQDTNLEIRCNFKRRVTPSNKKNCFKDVIERSYKKACGLIC